jgi:hypothetical protein
MINNYKIILFNYLKEQIIKNKIKFIINYKFNEVIMNRFIKSTNIKSKDNLKEIQNDLKIYFLSILLKQTNKEIGLILMNNQIVDELWHLMILDTEEYEKFCKKAFGKFLHHKITDNYDKKILSEYEKLTDIYIDKGYNIFKKYRTKF